MGYYLFLDDERLPKDVTWVQIPNVVYQVVRNYAEFVETILTHGVPEYVTFDHDLADEHYVAMLKENEARHTTFIDDEFGGLNLTFDYGSEKTGYDCCKWLVEYCANHRMKFPLYAVHSMNPVGRERINHYIENAKKHLDI